MVAADRFLMDRYLIGDETRRQELGLRQSQEDRLTPLLLLASGFYGWGQQVYDLMKVLVERRANVNELDVRGYNALFYLVEKAPWGKPTAGLERKQRAKYGASPEYQAWVKRTWAGPSFGAPPAPVDKFERVAWSGTCYPSRA